MDPFCDKGIINKEKFLESKYFYAIVDIMPVTKGHVLIVSKRHLLSFLDLNKNEMNELGKLIKRVIKIALRFAGGDGFDVISQNGESAGQSVFHFHVHIIPRKMSDKINKENEDWYKVLNENERKRLNDKQIKETVEKLKKISKEIK